MSGGDTVTAIAEPTKPPTRKELEQLAQASERRAGTAERNLAEATRQLEELRTDRDSWRAARAKDDEAEAIAGCVRALDELLGRHDRDRSGFGMVAAHFGPSHSYAVERVLRYLADRYGVPWCTPPAADVDPAVVEARRVLVEALDRLPVEYQR